ncbi:hypothetical protein [Amycolatopsis sp. cmx-4-54]|uniref:hypothetical protein n=1 Tax=Amycolatopsis sp. cmx-4-54 TaxID=2790936 RepID=UPI00397B2C37
MVTTLGQNTGPSRARRHATALAVSALGLMLGTTVATAAPASATDSGAAGAAQAAGPITVSGGGVDINGWCVARYGNPWHAELRGNNANSWVCQWGQDTAAWQAVDMYAACRRTYGSGSTADYTNFYNPYSWYCT